MRNVITLICLVCCSGVTFAQETKKMAMGLSMETRLQRDVNPDQSSLQPMGLLYGRYRVSGPFWILGETGYESHSGGSGSLQVKTESIVFGLWGRYEILRDRKWMPYVALGGGSYFDKVSTDFETSSDQRSGTRMFAGLGTGVSTTLWNYFSMEAEGRITFIELEKDPGFSMVLRAGAVF